MVIGWLGFVNVWLIIFFIVDVVLWGLVLCVFLFRVLSLVICVLMVLVYGWRVCIYCVDDEFVRWVILKVFSKLVKVLVWWWLCFFNGCVVFLLCFLWEFYFLCEIVLLCCIRMIVDVDGKLRVFLSIWMLVG